jgi:hypothetical protein
MFPDGSGTSPLHDALSLPPLDTLHVAPTSLGVQTELAGDGSLVRPTDPFDDGILGALAGLEPTEIVPLLGAVGVTALTATVIARNVCSPSASLLFTNVRLLPCYAGSVVEHVGHVGRSASQTSPRDSAARELDRIRHVGGRAFDTIAEGFSQAVEGDRKARGLTDSRLLVQIGIVLGLVYTAFLTLWFWATRIRWNPRRTA